MYTCYRTPRITARNTNINNETTIETAKTTGAPTCCALSYSSSSLAAAPKVAVLKVLPRRLPSWRLSDRPERICGKRAGGCVCGGMKG